MSVDDRIRFLINEHAKSVEDLRKEVDDLRTVVASLLERLARTEGTSRTRVRKDAP